MNYYYYNQLLCKTPPAVTAGNTYAAIIDRILILHTVVYNVINEQKCDITLLLLFGIRN